MFFASVGLSLGLFYFILFFCTLFWVSLCVCFFFPSILDIKFVGRTSWGHTGVTTEIRFFALKSKKEKGTG